MHASMHEMMHVHVNRYGHMASLVGNPAGFGGPLIWLDTPILNPAKSWAIHVISSPDLSGKGSEGTDRAPIVREFSTK